MSLKASELKAIAWYIDKYRLKPLLSTPPTMYFRGADGSQLIISLSKIVAEYSQWNKEDKKERARMRK